jgi:hypothetical protein
MKRFLRDRAKPRDAFFFAVGCVIAYNQVFMVKEAQPILIFTVLFLWGLIPAFWGDRTPGPPSPPPPPIDPPSGPREGQAGDGRIGHDGNFTRLACT